LLLDLLQVAIIICIATQLPVTYVASSRRPWITNVTIISVSSTRGQLPSGGGLPGRSSRFLEEEARRLECHGQQLFE